MDDNLRYVSEIEVIDFRHVIENHGQAVWNYVYFLVGKPDIADDITQDTFSKAYRYIATFRGDSSFRTWLIKIARNLASDYRKKSFFRKMILMDIIQDNKTSPSAEEEYLSKEFTDDIWRIVLDLPMKLREVLLLDAVHHMTMKEIADTLNISIGTVKSRIFRARAKVAKQLDKEND